MNNKKNKIGMSHARMSGNIVFAGFFALVLALVPHAAHADIFGFETDTDLSNIAKNIFDSISSLPALLSALCYLFGLILGISAIIKLKDHVENPAQNPLRVPAIRLLIGGGLFALPTVYQAMSTTINGTGENLDWEPGIFTISGLDGWLSATIGGFLGDVGIEDFNYILVSIIESLSEVPALISGIAYLLGLLFGVMGLIALKNHVENPDQYKLKDVLIRFIIGGMLFAIPNVYAAMQETITGNADDVWTLGGVLELIIDVDGVLNNYAGCDPVSGVWDGVIGGLGEIGGGSADSGQTVGGSLCNVFIHAKLFPVFLTVISYLFGLVLGLWGILKIQDHVLNPQQTPLWDGISRLIAAGCFFSLTIVVDAIKSTVAPLGVGDVLGSVLGILDSAVDILGNIGDFFGGIFGDGGGSGRECNGLDGALFCFVSDIYGPFSIVLNLFAMTAGTILIMIGISRLMKSAQEGARGPGGLGTMMTFITGGALISYNELMEGFARSFFNSAGIVTYGALQYDTGLTTDEIGHAHMVITSILQFMIIIGLISFVRGIFIIRGVAEGNGQASIMSGVTHMVGGALAFNLGPLLNAVQVTLGITQYGIVFGTL